MPACRTDRDPSRRRAASRRSRRTAPSPEGYAGWRVGGEWRLSGARRDNGTPLGGYGIVNLNARYDMAKSWYIAARIENLLDKHYETVYTYRTPKRGAYVTLAWQQQ